LSQLANIPDSSTLADDRIVLNQTYFSLLKLNVGYLICLLELGINGTELEVVNITIRSYRKDEESDYVVSFETIFGL
jgi:hypothetical protein